MRMSRCGVLCLLLSAYGAAGAEVRDTQASSIKLDISSQPLGDALNEFAKQARLQVVLYSRIGEGLVAPRITGNLSPQSALNRLLEKTGLRFEYIDADTVGIFAQREEDGSAPSAEPVAYGLPANVMRLAQTDTPASATKSESGELPDGERGSTAASGSEGKLEEIVVTAQKRIERLQDVPISIGVLTGESLDRSTSRGVTDFLAQVGGVSVIQSNPGESQIAIRGVLSALDAASSAIGFYLDETPFSDISSGRLPDMNAFDLDRVEVLRGPQGTLYGAGAMSGVVRVVTRDADLNEFQANGRLRASQTEHGGDNFNGDIALNLPIMPGVLAARAVYSHSELSGFIDSTCAPATSPACGAEDINHSKINSYRVKFNYQPTDELSIELGYSGYNIFTGAPSDASDQLTQNRSSDQHIERNLDVFSLTGQLDLPGLSLVSATSYREQDSFQRAEFDSAGFYFFGSFDATAFTQEFRASSAIDGPWSWTAGAMYGDTEESGSQDATWHPFFPNPLRVDGSSRQWATFGELTRSFADDTFDVTLGLRYFEDSQTLDTISYFFPAVPLPAPASTKFDALTWRLVASYRPNDDLTLYGSVATGFRSGKFQSVSALISFPDFPPVSPDELTNYEVGAKGKLFSSLSYDIAIYYTDWQDLQQTFLIPQGFQAYLNAGSAAGPGVDLTLNYHPTDSFSLGLSLGWNDLVLQEDIYAGSPSVLLFAEGTRVNDSPEWTGSVTAEYRTPFVATGLDLVWAGNYTFSTERVGRYLNGATVSQGVSDTYGLVNTSVGLKGDHWTISLFADNVFDEDAAIGSRSIFNSLQADRARPRTIGLQLNFHF